ncbi:glycosyltransferase family 2 protein [Myroides marinus]|uniref:glycosyltransferase family 2 protein n=1 Tax=Myroides marinus TaxID=703342 RepID=UPI002574E0BE|nr:glycosyltransferase family 2 protein [Myroides marinus]MDM1380710.1 glycosyltransferase family 2 protein [Myroides marinus]MDM1387976.1 glycosyltransferase family 2 protein [Myroides marinus]MDM1395194.1 glycosyltransferase family 2 protein [Myroides marinus]
MKEKVTIAIPFFNAELYLEEAIQSVLNQTYKNWKLLLVDDGSTDNSIYIAKKFVELDDRVVLFTDGENKNLGFRLNEIPTLVSTKYLARMDADDIMHPERIEKQLKTLEDNPEIDVLGTNSYSIDEANNVIGIRMNTDKSLNFVSVENFIHPTIMAKTSWFLENKYDVDAVRMEDAELWYRTKEISVFKCLVEPLFFYREFGAEYWKKYFKTLETKDYILTKYKGTYWDNYFKKMFIKAWIYRFFSYIGKEQILINRRNAIRFKEINKIDSFLK